MSNPVQTVPDNKTIDLDSLTQTFLWDGADLVGITVTLNGDTYRQTFTYSGGDVDTISAWEKQ